MILYYLVAGRIPPASVYTRHAPAVPARNFRPSFPPGLDPVIKRATRPDPDKRYPDVEAMKRAFSSALEAIEDRSPERRETVPQMTVAVDRHIGIAKRERNPENQDNVFKGVAEDGAFGLIVVADGVSTASYGTGEVASRQLVESAEEVWEEVLPAYLMEEEIREVETVDRILERANERIIDYINERHTPFTGSAHEVMGTTGLVALYHRGIITLGAVGDSRAYLQRGPGLEQLTIDHNLWTLSILEGLPADEALSMPRGDALARCLGTFVMNDEMLEPVPSGIDIYQIPVASGDTLLLTTDGLVDFAGGNVISSEENILATLLAEPDPALACLELILLANRGGGGDNIGLGVARFD
jgi:serine/threonine protein phosphatase PrpC